MTTFFVGQRVRIISARTPAGNACVGKQATIIVLCNREKKIEIEVDATPSPSGATWKAFPYQLEPISDSNDLVSWESMRDLWVPEHLRVAA